MEVTVKIPARVVTNKFSIRGKDVCRQFSVKVIQTKVACDLIVELISDPLRLLERSSWEQGSQGQ